MRWYPIGGGTGEQQIAHWYPIVGVQVNNMCRTTDEEIMHEAMEEIETEYEGSPYQISFRYINEESDEYGGKWVSAKGDVHKGEKITTGYKVYKMAPPYGYNMVITYPDKISWLQPLPTSYMPPIPLFMNLAHPTTAEQNQAYPNQAYQNQAYQNQAEQNQAEQNQAYKNPAYKASDYEDPILPYTCQPPPYPFEESKEPENNFCGNCGASNIGKNNFCKQCGKAFWRD